MGGEANATSKRINQAAQRHQKASTRYYTAKNQGGKTNVRSILRLRWRLRMRLHGAILTGVSQQKSLAKTEAVKTKTAFLFNLFSLYSDHSPLDIFFSIELILELFPDTHRCS